MRPDNARRERPTIPEASSFYSTVAASNTVSTRGMPGSAFVRSFKGGADHCGFDGDFCGRTGDTRSKMCHGFRYMAIILNGIGKESEGRCWSREEWPLSEVFALGRVLLPYAREGARPLAEPWAMPRPPSIQPTCVALTETSYPLG